MSRFRSLIVAFAALAPAPAIASDDPAALCLKAAARAAEATGVPYEVLTAVSVVETGRGQRPWPWTVNLGGDGRWLDSMAEAEELVLLALSQGMTNLDLGCFQLNYYWHGAAFASVADMLDPDRNALYAAEYLSQHYAETGDWALAAAAYHSATPEHAERYLARFEATAMALAEPDPMPEWSPRSNGFPLLVTGASGQNGSLVPATEGGVRLIGAP